MVLELTPSNNMKKIWKKLQHPNQFLYYAASFVTVINYLCYINIYKLWAVQSTSDFTPDTTTVSNNICISGSIQPC